MDWFTWYPSIHWQHAAFAVVLIIALSTVLLAVPRRKHGKPII